jgi:hypothetical protein
MRSHPKSAASSNSTAVTDLPSLFSRLRALLEQHAGEFSVAEDSASCYCLEAKLGSAILSGSRGKRKRLSTVPVALVEVGKTSVSYHLMGMYDCQRLLDGMTKELRARLQGKACFVFRNIDDKVLKELETLTTEGLLAFRKAEFVSK